MTEQEIRDNTPSGATHYGNIDSEIWYFRFSNLIGAYVTFHNGMWVSCWLKAGCVIKPL